MSPDFVRDGTQLAIAEMLRAGITAFADMYLFPEEAARAASARPHACGDRTSGDGWSDRLGGQRYRDTWRRRNSSGTSTSRIRGCRCISRLTMLSAPSDQTLARVRRVADELDARVAMYLAPGEVHVNHTGGRSPLVRLRELGLLGPGFTAIHLGGVDAEELKIAADDGHLCSGLPAVAP